MLVSTVLNLFFIPVLYILVETLRERGAGVESGRESGGPAIAVTALDGEAKS
jgi:hypothetical protein